jgi:hypothetical protein
VKEQDKDRINRVNDQVLAIDEKIMELEERGK